MLALVSAGLPLTSLAQGDDSDDELGQIITPDIQRRHIKEADLDSEDFELGAYYGLLNIEDFGSSGVAGVTLAYHVTEDFFIEGAYGSSEAQKTSYELLSGGVELLTPDERKFTYYNLSLGYNFLPGQIYFSDKLAFNSTFYLIAGAGNTKFAAKQHFTYNLGAGLRFYGTDWLALDLSMRDYVFSHDIFGASKTTNNLEMRFGVSVFF